MRMTLTQDSKYFFFYWPFQGGSSAVLFLYFCAGGLTCCVCFVIICSSSPSFVASGRLCVVIVAFPKCPRIVVFFYTSFHNSGIALRRFTCFIHFLLSPLLQELWNVFLFYFTHLTLEPYKRNIGIQCRPRPDATEQNQDQGLHCLH